MELPMTIKEPAMLLGSYELQVTEYDASEAGQARGSERLAVELTKVGHASIITGELGIFKGSPFIRVLQNAVRVGRPTLDLIFHCHHLVQPGAGNGLALKPNAKQLLLDCLEEEWPVEGRDGIDRSDVRVAVEDALAADVLRVYVVRRRVEDRPHSVVLDNGSLGIQQVHRRREYSKAWFVENPAGFIRKYRTEHQELKSQATRLL